MGCYCACSMPCRWREGDNEYREDKVCNCSLDEHGAVGGWVVGARCWSRGESIRGATAINLLSGNCGLMGRRMLISLARTSKPVR